MLSGVQRDEHGEWPTPFLTLMLCAAGHEQSCVTNLAGDQPYIQKISTAAVSLRYGTAIFRFFRLAR